jgi:hypothetical protein
VAVCFSAGACFGASTPFWLSEEATKGVTDWQSAVEIQDGGFLLLGSGWKVDPNVVTDKGLKGDEPLVVRLARLSADGSLRWVQNYGDLPRTEALGLSISGDNGACILAATYKQRVGGEGSLWVFKVDARGRMIWNVLLGGSYKGILTRSHGTFSVSGTKDGRCVVVGGTATERSQQMQVRVVLVDARGKIQWDRAYGPKPASVAFAIAVTNGGYLVGGVTAGPNELQADALLLKLDSDGVLLSEHRYGDADTKEFVITY